MFLALDVLQVALLFYNQFRPYKLQKLNLMEAASLSISCILCIIQGIAHSEQDEKIVGCITSVMIMIVLPVFFMYMMYENLVVCKNSVQD